MRSRPRFFDCENCPSYCCTYTQIEVKPEDVERLANHLGMDTNTASRRLTMPGETPGSRVMRHFRDPVFGAWRYVRSAPPSIHAFESAFST